MLPSAEARHPRKDLVLDNTNPKGCFPRISLAGGAGRGEPEPPEPRCGLLGPQGTLGGRTAVSPSQDFDSTMNICAPLDFKPNQRSRVPKEAQSPTPQRGRFEDPTSRPKKNGKPPSPAHPTRNLTSVKAKSSLAEK
uniref:Uncharacterized protein n=1 Tax=Molossus molossus TaxID=27622 RepID=A0A7J8I824_MOLMO|nr:hypothetical protein HJG59_010574 [Molossus molossus]